MNELTTEQRAVRRAKKINNRIAKELPLFNAAGVVGMFFTSIENEKKAVERWDAINVVYFKRLEDVDKEFVERAESQRALVAALVTPAQLQEMDKEIAGMCIRYSAYRNNPAYIADYWTCLLKRVNELREYK